MDRAQSQAPYSESQFKIKLTTKWIVPIPTLSHEQKELTFRPGIKAKSTIEV